MNDTDEKTHSAEDAEYTDVIDIKMVEKALLHAYPNAEDVKLSFKRAAEILQQISDQIADAEYDSDIEIGTQEPEPLDSIAKRLFIPSDPEYQYVFTTTSSERQVGIFQITKDGNTAPITQINTPLLQLIGSTYSEICADTGTQPDEIKISVQKLLEAAGIDANAKSVITDTDEVITRADARQRTINRFLSELDAAWGRLPNDMTAYKIVAVHSYNPDTEILTFASPFLGRLAYSLYQKQAIQENSKGKKKPLVCFLMHPTAANERDKAAVEMAERLLIGVQQRVPSKPSPGKPYKYDISCQRLIQECPQMIEKISKQLNTSRKTQQINRSFKAMYKILRNKTDLFTYYTDVTISEVIPTMKSLDANIVITTTGKNPDFHRPFTENNPL